MDNRVAFIEDQTNTGQHLRVESFPDVGRAWLTSTDDTGYQINIALTKGDAAAVIDVLLGFLLEA